MKKLAWSLTSDEGHHGEVWLEHGKPVGELRLTLKTGAVWCHEMNLDEIVIFASNDLGLINNYLDEMILNGKAATVVVH